jgi:hypothetical protein
MLSIIVKLLDTKNFKINTLTLRIIGDIVSFPSSNKAVEIILHNGVFDIFRNMLCEPNTQKSKQILWSISNIIVGGSHCLNAFLTDEFLFSRVKALTKNH